MKKDDVFDFFIEDFMLQEFKKEIIENFPELVDEILEEGKLANIVMAIAMLAAGGAAGAAIQKAINTETLNPQQANEYVMKVQKENMDFQEAWGLLNGFIRLASLAASNRKKNQLSAEQLRAIDTKQDQKGSTSQGVAHEKPI